MDMTTTSSCNWQQAAGLHHLLHGATPAPSRPLEGGQQQQRRQQQPPLRCPRCDSTNTKFCYYNNYSLSQPRHFCKACKRYWTRGGTLRNVPVGGGCRKNKRIKRTASVAAPTGTSSSSSNKNNNPLLHIPTTNNSSHMIKTTTLPTSSDLSPLFYSLSSASSNILQMDTIGIINEFESILTTPLPIGTTAPNEFQPQEHCSLPTSTSLLQDYSMQLGPSLVSSSYPEGARTTKTTTPSSSSWLPFYQGLQGGVYAGDANLGGLLMKEIKEEDGRGLELQPTCSENQLEPLPSGAINPLWSSVMSGEWSTEPAASTLFESSASTPLISSESLLD